MCHSVANVSYTELLLFSNICIGFHKKTTKEPLHDKQEVMKELHNVVMIVKPQSTQSLIWLGLAPQSSAPY